MNILLSYCLCQSAVGCFKDIYSAAYIQALTLTNTLTCFWNPTHMHILRIHTHAHKPFSQIRTGVPVMSVWVPSNRPRVTSVAICPSVRADWLIFLSRSLPVFFCYSKETKCFGWRAAREKKVESKRGQSWEEGKTQQPLKKVKWLSFRTLLEWSNESQGWIASGLHQTGTTCINLCSLVSSNISEIWGKVNCWLCHQGHKIVKRINNAF